MTLRRWLLGFSLLAVAGSRLPATAADHTDGPAASADPAADLTDVFAWMSPDSQTVNLILNVTKNASTASRFSDQVQYVLHLDSQASYGAAVTETDVICQFTAAQRIQCWAGNDEYVTGDASNPAGITASDRKMRVFAGLRNDPFFFELTGFKETAKIVSVAAPALVFDPAGCPRLDAATSSLLVNQLRTGVGGAPPRDDFASLNVLSLVVSIDKSIVTRGGPILGVWAGTYRR